jgi:hypothetical protein
MAVARPAAPAPTIATSGDSGRDRLWILLDSSKVGLGPVVPVVGESLKVSNEAAKHRGHALIRGTRGSRRRFLVFIPQIDFRELQRRVRLVVATAVGVVGERSNKSSSRRRERLIGDRGERVGCERRRR